MQTRCRTSFALPILFHSLLVLGLASGCARRDPVAPDASGSAGSPVEVDLALTPDSASVPAGVPVRFEARTVMSDGSRQPATATWTSSGGSMSSDGSFVALETGTYTIRATGGKSGRTKTGRVTVTSATVQGLSISPDSAVVFTGGVRAFTATARMSDGSSVTVVPTWTASGGTIDGTGRYIAPSTPMTARVVASLNGVSDTATVTVVAPTVTLLQVLPDTATVRAGQTRQFAAEAVLSDGRRTAVPVTWSATRGTVTATGLFTAGSTAGVGRVIARMVESPFLADTSTVTIPVEPTRCEVTPAAVNLGAGGQQQFAVTEFRNNGTSGPAVATWSATGGQVSSSGLYTAGSMNGIYRVTATLAAATTIACRADVTVAATSAPQVVRIDITPSSASLNAGASLPLTATARLSDSTDATVPLSWSATGGSVTSSGVYTAPSTAGTYLVIARSDVASVADTATVTVNLVAPPPSGGLNTDLATNLPSGMTLLGDVNWDRTPMGPFQNGSTSNDGNSYVRVVTDANAPDGDVNVLEQGYNQVPDGYDPKQLDAGMAFSRGLFVATLVKFSDTFDFGPSGIKWLLFQGAGNLGWLSLQRNGASPYNGQNPGVGWVKPGVSGGDPPNRPLVNIPINRNTWYKVQLYVEIQPVPRFRVWINDTLVHDVTNFSWPGGSSAVFANFKLGSTWGGGNGFAAPNMNVRYARTAIWRRN